MAAAQFDIPEIKDDIEVPKLREGAMAHVQNLPCAKGGAGFHGLSA